MRERVSAEAGSGRRLEFGHGRGIIEAEVSLGAELEDVSGGFRNGVAVELEREMSA